MITYNLIRKIIKDPTRSSIITHHLKNLGIDSLEKLENLPQHGLTVAGYSTHKLASQLREALESAEEEE